MKVQLVRGGLQRVFVQACVDKVLATSPGRLIRIEMANSGVTGPSNLQLIDGQEASQRIVAQLTVDKAQTREISPHAAIFNSGLFAHWTSCDGLGAFVEYEIEERKVKE